MRILFVLSSLVVFSFAGVWSSLGSSGIAGAYNELNSFVESKNDEIKSFWNTNIKNLLDKIEKESKERENNLKQLEVLNKELLLNKKEIDFLLKKNNELLSVKANVNAM